jgi:protein ERP2
MLSLSLRVLLFFIVFAVIKVYSNELTFELPDNARECFHEKLKVGSKYVLEFQVIQLNRYRNCISYVVSRLLQVEIMMLILN